MEDWSHVHFSMVITNDTSISFLKELPAQGLGCVCPKHSQKFFLEAVDESPEEVEPAMKSSTKYIGCN